MYETPVKLVRPEKHPDGEGGYTESVVLSRATTLWGDVVLHQRRPFIVLHAEEDVQIGDYLVV